MYDYTKNIYKAVKSTLKTQIKVFLQAKYKQQKRERTAFGYGAL